ncbi:hypothetical protein BOX15_Mlig011202g3, partial [Macrostomum lignano]
LHPQNIMNSFRTDTNGASSTHVGPSSNLDFLDLTSSLAAGPDVSQLLTSTATGSSASAFANSHSEDPSATLNFLTATTSNAEFNPAVCVPDFMPLLPPQQHQQQSANIDWMQTADQLLAQLTCLPPPSSAWPEEFPGIQQQQFAVPPPRGQQHQQKRPITGGGGRSGPSNFNGNSQQQQQQGGQGRGHKGWSNGGGPSGFSSNGGQLSPSTAWSVTNKWQQRHGNSSSSWQQQQQQFHSNLDWTGNPLDSLRSCLDSVDATAGAMDSNGNAALAAVRSEERFSRKVFVGGLPPDIDEDEIGNAFRRFGPLTIDWPHKQDSKTYFPPKGYCFILFQDESSVQSLMEACISDGERHYWCVSSPTMKDKPVQIRPWRLSESDFVLDASQPLDPRKTIFVGGVPRPLRACELANIMNSLYGGVCYAGIDTDPELKYPKGAGRVAFSSQQSYIAAISARFVQLRHGADIDKRVEVKPYVLDDQMCDECGGAMSGGKFAPFFCANVTCLQYYCDHCWGVIHDPASGRQFHKPLVKEGADRPRTVPFRW